MDHTFSYRNYKHPLKHSWTMWYLDRSQQWTERLMEIGSFDTEEDFWCLTHHIKPTNMLSSGCDYMLFRTGIRPVWDDESNKRIGRWVVELDKKTYPLPLNKYWIEMQLNLISEKFHPRLEMVKGASVSVNHSGNSLGLWTGDAEIGVKEIISIGMNLKALMRCPPSKILSYEVHQDAKNEAESKFKYYV